MSQFNIHNIISILSLALDIGGLAVRFQENTIILIINNLYSPIKPVWTDKAHFGNINILDT